MLLISYTVTVFLGYCFRMQREIYFTPLCIASTFANIVALPIIIFPTLCEYGVVQDLVREDIDVDGFSEGEDSLMDVCNKQANAVVFTYFFGVSIVFWSIGHRTLRLCKVNVPSRRVNEERRDESEESNDITCTGLDGNSTILASTSSGIIDFVQTKLKSIFIRTRDAFLDIVKSPAVIAMILGFITACIPPLQTALFDDGGSLRVIGSALESLSSAGTTFATIVVAASLVEVKDFQGYDGEVTSRNRRLRRSVKRSSFGDRTDEEMRTHEEIYGDKRKEEKELRPLERKTSISNYLRSIQVERLKIHIWHVTSRLIVTPGLVFLVLLRLDCIGWLNTVPNIAKLVLLINSAVPGALVVVVILKAEGLTNEAEAVSKCYLPSYTLSVITLAMWASFGLMVFRPDSGICGTNT